MNAYCLWLHEAAEEPDAAAEVRDLGALERAGLPVPVSLVVGEPLQDALFASRKLKGVLSKGLHGLNAGLPELVPGVAAKLRAAIVAAPLPAEAIVSLDRYVDELRTRLLKDGRAAVAVSLRLLASDPVTVTAELRTGKDLHAALLQAFALRFTDQALYGRLRRGDPAVPDAAPILVSFARTPEAVGEAAPHDAEARDDATVRIHAWPLGKPASGAVESMDAFRVDKKSLTLLSRELATRWWAVSSSGKAAVPSIGASGRHTISDEQAVALARLIMRADAVVEASASYEWASVGGHLIVTAVRRAGTDPRSAYAPSQAGEGVPGPLLQGLGVSFGRRSGPVRLVTGKRLPQLDWGDVVVAERLDAKQEAALGKAGAFILESGTSASAGAKLAKRLMIPAVTGIGTALADLKDGQVVTVDGFTGAVWPGTAAPESPDPVPDLPVTGTKVWVTADDPYRLDAAAIRRADGIGIMRGEFILRSLRLHPHDVLRHNRAEEYRDVLAEGVAAALKAAYPRPVIYQLHDVASFDLIGLRPKHEERHEPNPALGYRGAHRLLSEPELLALELEALAGVAGQGADNLSVMIPMARSVKEVERMLKVLDSSALGAGRELDVWVKCETPGLLVVMEDLCGLPIAGVCFEVPTIAQFMQGIDKENRQIAHHLDTADEAVLQALEYAIRACHEQGVATMLVAEYDRLRPETVQAAVEAGVSGVAVSQDQSGSMRHLLASVEQRVMLDHALLG